MAIEQNIWVPESHTDRGAVLVEKAIKQYDENLRFGRNMDTGQWCIFVRMPHDNDQGFPPLWPVLGFDRIPEPDFALHRLRQTDTLRYGLEIRERLDKAVAADQKVRADAVDEGNSITAEAMESFYHRQGKTAYHRSLRKRDPKQRSVK